MIKLQLKLLCCIGFASVGTVHAASLYLVTFDELSPGPNDNAFIPNGYTGLQWFNFGVLNGYHFPTYGYRTGTISPQNVAFNRYGEPASISNGSAFDLNSAYLTAASNVDLDLQITVRGFIGTTLSYENTYTVNENTPTLVNFNYFGVDRVTFISSPENPFAMDNLSVTVPEPNASVLFSVSAALGALRVISRKGRRATAA